MTARGRKYYDARRITFALFSKNGKFFSLFGRECDVGKVLSYYVVRDSHLIRYESRVHIYARGKKIVEVHGKLIKGD